MGKEIFVTVGSTQFDGLISAIDTLEFVNLAKELGYTKIVAQIGNYKGEVQLIEAFRYAKPHEIKKHFKEADIVIGHAGAGTIMEVLQMGTPLLVVINDDLMGNHQVEVAQALSTRGVLQMACLSEFLEVFKRNQFVPKKLELNCDSVISAIEAHFHFE
jgi:beta-1,4-N-acetylglucosaminyltransferase